MKNRMLLVSNSPTTSTGIRSYLEPIFRGYVELEAKMTADVTARMMEQFDLVLFASKEAQKELAKQLTPKIHYLTCIRTFNHTYLNRILVIPPGARVYLVNDSESTTIDSINMLNDFGITQYEWVPWYPGREDLDYTISYAVTLGEGRFVPKHIPTVIDIGARIADISTISEIASFFHLPMGLADLVTKNYINQFVQLLKISNHQLSQAANTRFVTQSIIGNISSGVCILSGDGEVSMVNESFLLAMRTKKSNLVGLPFAEAFPEITGKYGTDLSQYPPFLTVHPDGEASLELGFQEIEDIRHQKQFLIHCLGQETGRAVGETREHTPVYYNFSDYRSVNGAFSRCWRRRNGSL